MMHRTGLQTRRLAARPRRLAAAAIAVAAIASAATLPPRAAAADTAAYGDLLPLSPGALARLRGGFVTPDGLRLSVAANVRTMVDGQLLLQSVLVPDRNGAFVPAAPPVSAPSLPPGVSRIVGGVVVDGDPTAVPDAAALSALARASGVVIDDARGFTAAFHQISPGSLSNVIVNQAAGRTVTQRMEIVISVQNFTEMLPQLRQGALGGALGLATQRGTLRGLR